MLNVAIFGHQLDLEAYQLCWNVLFVGSTSDLWGNWGKNGRKKPQEFAISWVNLNIIQTSLCLGFLICEVICSCYNYHQLCPFPPPPASYTRAYTPGASSHPHRLVLSWIVMWMLLYVYLWYLQSRSHVFLFRSLGGPGSHLLTSRVPFSPLFPWNLTI